MKLAILSRAPRAYSTQRLRTAALDRGHDVKVLNTLRFAIDLSGPEPDLQFRGKALSDYDAILPRIGNSITYFGTAVVRQFEQMDVYTPNTANGIMNSRDKLRATQILSRHSIGMPATVFVRNRAEVSSAIDMVGGAPVVIKLLEGTQGIGVILAPTKKVAEAIIETLHGTNQQVLIQKFVKESKGKDVRALVVGDRVSLLEADLHDVMTSRYLEASIADQQPTWPERRDRNAEAIDGYVRLWEPSLAGRPMRLWRRRRPGCLASCASPTAFPSGTCWKAR